MDRLRAGVKNAFIRFMTTKQTIIPPSATDAPFGALGPYAGILPRFLALCVDKLIINVSLLVLFLPLGLVASVGSFFLMPPLAAGQAALTPSLWALTVLVDWIYFASFESGARGASLGKRLMGLRVTDEAGGRLSFGKASLRYFSKILSALPLFLGFVLAAFTPRRQALHDLIAGSLVTRSG